MFKLTTIQGKVHLRENIYFFLYFGTLGEKDYAFDMLEMAVKIVAQVSTWEREC